MSKMFKIQAIGVDVSVQRHTDKVPSDGRYYLIKEGEVVKSFRVKGHAIKAFRALLEELGYEPPSKNEKVDSEEILRAEIDDIEFYRSATYWSRSHEYRDGGKLRHR
jgi:hypothetical protein